MFDHNLKTIVPRNSSKLIGISDAATSWAFTAGWSVSKRMPERAARAAFQAGADYLWWQNTAGVPRLKSNLARVRPWLTNQELEILARSGMRSYMRYWCEAFRLPTYTPSRISESFDLQGKELLDSTMQQGKGAIMIPGHMANWDLAGAWATQRYGALTTVAEQLKPKDLFDQFLQYRESLGMEVLPLGNPHIIRALIRRLREGRLVALLGDRDLTDSGVLVDFFGGKASFPAGPALLSIMTGAPLHPVTMHNEKHMTIGTVYPRIEVPTVADRSEQITIMTQQIAHAFEIGISEHPEDWHMLQKVWVD